MSLPNALRPFQALVSVLHHMCRGTRRWCALLLVAVLPLAVVPRIAQAQTSGASPAGGSVTPDVLTTDTIPPTVTITPSGGSFTNPSVAVSIGWCDNSSLLSTARTITLDGTPQTDTYTTGTKTGCVKYATSTLTLSLPPGTHTLFASIQDAAGNEGVQSAVFSYTPYTVTVTADSSPVTRGPGVTAAQTFKVQSTGSQGTTYLLRVSCTGAAFASCSVPSSIALTTGQTATVTATYTTGSTVTSGSLTLTAKAQPDTTELGTASTTVNVVAAAYGVTVSGDSGTKTRPSRTDGATTYTVTNTGNTPTIYTLRLSCPSVVFASCSAPTALTVPNARSAKVTVGYTTAVGPASGTLGLTALAQLDTTKQATGGDGVSVQAVPLIALVNTLPGTRERSQCLAFGIVESLATDCGTIRVTHPLPSVTTYGKARTPTLVYYSDAVQGPVIGADVTPRTGLSVDSVRLHLYRVDPSGEVPVDTMRTYRSWGCNVCTQRVAALTGNYQTSIKKYHLYAKVYSGGNSTPDTGSAFSEIPQVYRVGSKFGAGWWLAGTEQLVFAQPDTAGILWIGGDESTRKYTWLRYDATANRAYYVAPSITRPDTLIHNYAAGYSANPWYRVLPHGDTVFFNGSGWHVKTVSRLNTTTQFYWSAGSGTDPQLDSLLVPGGLKYRWYRSASLDSITAPGANGNRTTKLYHFDVTSRNRGDSLIVDPDGSKVAFTFFSWASDYAYNGRTDRRGTYTHFEWEGYSPDLSYATTPANPAQNVVQTFRNAYAIGAPPGTAPLVRDSVYTRYIDPRGYVTKFWVNDLGAPVKLVNALNQTTLIRYTDGRFPGLATETVAPNGLVTRAWYNARGLVDSATTYSPYGDGRNATTSYRWDGTWPSVTHVTNAAGDSANFGYDPATGNLLWREDGRGSSTRVQYRYYVTGTAARLLRAVETPDHARDSIAYHPTLVNLVSSWTPLGRESRTEYDAVGRPTVHRSPLDSAQTVWRDDSTSYDVMDRVTRAVQYGPALGAASAGRVVVRSFYNAEGSPDSLERTVIPDSAAVGRMVTRYQYDGLGRTIAEFAPDGMVDSTLYDLGSDVIRHRTRRGFSITQSFDVLGRLQSRIVPEVVYNDTSVSGTNYNWHLPKYANCQTVKYCVPADTATFTYDVMGRLVTANNRSARISRGYFPGGALAADTSRVRTLADIGAGGDFISHVYAIGYSYDTEGRRTKLKLSPNLAAPFASGALRDSITYQYHPQAGFLSVVRDVIGNAFMYVVDSIGRVSRIGYANGDYKAYAYDPDGRVTTIRQDVSASGGTSNDIQLVYDPADRLAHVYPSSTNPNISVGYSYNGLGASLGEIGTRQYNSTLSLHPDPLGNEFTDGTTATGMDSYQNEHNNSSSSWSNFEGGTGRRTGGSGFAESMLTCQAEGSLCQSANTYTDYTDAARYDGAGNLSWTFKSQRDSIVTYYYPSTQVSHSATATAKYYGADEKLAAVDERAAQTEQTQDWPSAFVEYRYDALGRRVLLRTRDCLSVPDCQAQSARAIWDGSSLIAEINFQESDPERDDAWTTTADVGRVIYTNGTELDQPLSITRVHYGAWDPFASTVWWDHRGHGYGESIYPVWPCTGTGTSQVCVSRLSWPERDAMLRPITTLGPSPTPTPSLGRFSGSLPLDQRDATGQLYRRNRYYDLATGRFTQEDPIRLAGGLNAYGFGAGDPVNYSDPFGLFGMPKWWNRFTHTLKTVITLATGGAFGDPTPSDKRLFPDPVPPVLAPVDKPGEKKEAKDEDDQKPSEHQRHIGSPSTIASGVTFIITILPALLPPIDLSPPNISAPELKPIPVAVPVCSPMGCVPAPAPN